MKKLFRSTLIVFVIVLQSSITQAQLSNSFTTSGLVAYYPFNGNANDQSGNGNNGTVNGATLTTDRFGNANSAYSFNGINNYISVPNSPSLQNLNSISMSAWVYINAWYFTNAFYFPILHKSNQQSTYGEYSVLLSSTSVISTLINQENVASDTNWNFKSWYNVLVTISSSDTTSVYINGNAIYSGISTSHSLNTVDSLPLLIGVDYPSFIEYANGKIDDIAIWNRVLSDSEIVETYNYTGGNVGINTTNPARNLDINNTLRLEPRNSAPQNPAAGDIYFDATLKMLRVFDGSVWQNCW